MATGIMKESNDTIPRKDIDEEKRQKREIRDAWIGVVKGGVSGRQEPYGWELGL